MLFISHRLEEIFAICRHGHGDARRRRGARRADRRADAPTTWSGGWSAASSARCSPSRTPRSASRCSRSIGSRREGVFFDISFDVRAGEIVALAGLVGAGRSEVARAIFGIDRADAGHVEVGGVRAAGRPPAAAMRAGLALRAGGPAQAGPGHGPVDRAQHDAHAAASAHAARADPRPAPRTRWPREWAERLQLKFHRLDDPVGTLSGGNQQKVVLAKWLATEPKLLIVDEPTRGIDVGTKAEVHRLMSELAAAGLAVLMISSELPEVLGHGRPRARHARGPAEPRAARAPRPTRRA